MSVNQVPVAGFVAPGFGKVRDAFCGIFAADGGLGASLGVYAGGEKVVELWGGVADPGTGRPWDSDTVSVIFSATKVAVAILAQLLEQRGALDFDAPVTAYWPEFGGGGKSTMPVRYLFTHQAGLPYLDQQLSFEEVLEGSRIVEVLEQQVPMWVPGGGHGYHAMTYGWLAGALIRKITGKRLGQVFAAEIANRLGLDFFIGLPAGQESRVARPVEAPPPDLRALAALDQPGLKAAVTALAEAARDPQSPLSRAVSTNGALPTPDAATWNDPRVYRSEIPAANGITNGQSLARLYAATVSKVGGIRLLSEQTVDKARAEQVNGPDRIMMFPTRYGTGFQLPAAGEPLLSPDSFGQIGSGGVALGFADTRHRVGFGYAQNRLLSMPADRPHTCSLIAAVREALGAQAISSQAIDLCMGVITGSTGLWINTCNGGPSQTWKIKATGTITNSANGYCMDVHDSGTTAGTSVDIAGCSSDVAQQWRIRSDGSLEDRESGLCLATQSNDTSPGTPLLLESCNNTAAREWTLPALAS